MQLRITGLEQVQKRLREAPSLLVAKAFYKALDRAAGVIAAEVEARAPDTDEGVLKENVITNVVIESGLRGGTAAVGFSTTQSERTGKPADLIAYWVEFGHRMVTHSGKVIGQVEPYPFMRPAGTAAADRAIEAFGDTLIDNLSVIEK